MRTFVATSVGAICVKPSGVTCRLRAIQRRGVAGSVDSFGAPEDNEKGIGVEPGPEKNPKPEPEAEAEPEQEPGPELEAEPPQEPGRNSNRNKERN